MEDNVDKSYLVYEALNLSDKSQICHFAIQPFIFTVDVKLRIDKHIMLRYDSFIL